MSDIQYPLVDAGNAQRIADLFGHRLRWVLDWRCWIVHDGVRWERQADDVLAEGIAKEAALEISEEARLIADDDQRRQAHLRWAAKSLSHGTVRAAVASARSIPSLHVKSTELDQDPYALNCMNGTVDLRTGELRPHNSADFITRVVPRDYVPNVYSPLWDGLLKRATAVDPSGESASFLELMLGYSLIGGNPENRMFFIIGPAGTGKSKIVELPVDVLGTDYGYHAKASLITRGRNEVNTEELAVLEHKRFMSISETDGSMTLDEARVKTITGARQMSYRSLYSKVRVGNVESTFVIGTNEPPTIEKFDDAIARRLVIIRSGPTLTPNEKDINLDRRILDHEAEGVLSSLVRGAVRWHMMSQELSTGGVGAGGAVFDVHLPAAVAFETSAFKYDHDPVIEFVDEFLEFGDHFTESPTRISDAYGRFRGGNRNLGSRALYAKIQNVAGERGRPVVKTPREFVGIRLRLDHSNLRHQWERP